MPNTLSDQNEKTTISIGSDPIDKTLVGGQPLGSLTLIEDSSGTGKSIVMQLGPDYDLHLALLIHGPRPAVAFGPAVRPPSRIAH